MFLKIKFSCDFAVGTDGYRYVKIDDDSPRGYIYEICDEYARQNLESYSYLLPEGEEADPEADYWYDYEKVDSIPEGELFEDLTSDA